MVPCIGKLSIMTSMIRNYHCLEHNQGTMVSGESLGLKRKSNISSIVSPLKLFSCSMFLRLEVIYFSAGGKLLLGKKTWLLIMP